MLVFDRTTVLKNHLLQYYLSQKKVGLVPTMGALHEGHAALINNSVKENDITVCSIFVNPIQFNQLSDLNAYPRDLQKDKAFLEVLGCDILFCPSSEEMYPEKPMVNFSFGNLESSMEGAFRAGHFNGVGLVVTKLFNIVKPTRAYFGQKDLQQYLIIDRLVKELNFDIELVCAPIVREKNGLAISSRNQRLTKGEKEIATHLFKALNLAQEMLINNHTTERTKTEVINYLSEWEEITLEYFEIVDKNSLIIMENILNKKDIALCIAANVGTVRLIDNIFLLN